MPPSSVKVGRVGWQIAVPWPATQAARVALLALVYLAAARLSLSLAIPPGYATPVWPPSGLAVAAVLLLGKRIWPGIWAGAFAANLSVEASIFSAVVIACGNTIEALVAGALAGRWVAGGGRFRRTEHVFGFFAIAALSACIAATLALVGAGRRPGAASLRANAGLPCEQAAAVGRARRPSARPVGGSRAGVC